MGLLRSAVDFVALSGTRDLSQTRATHASLSLAYLRSIIAAVVHAHRRGEETWRQDGEF